MCLCLDRIARRWQSSCRFGQEGMRKPRCALEAIIQVPPTPHTICNKRHIETIHCTLYIMPYALHTIHHVLDTIYYTPYTTHSILYTLHYILCTLYYALYTILYTSHYILYPLHYTPPSPQGTTPGQLRHGPARPASATSEEILYKKIIKLKPLWQWSLLKSMFFTGNIKEFVWYLLERF